MVVLRLLVLVLALLGLGSCWSPVFDRDVSLAALTTSKLSLDAQFTATIGYNSDNTTYLAVPTPFRPPTEVSVASLTLSGFGMTTVTNQSGSWSSGGSTAGNNYDSAVADPELTTLSAGLDGASLASFQPAVGGGTISFIDGGNSTQYSMATVIGASTFPTSTSVTLYALALTIPSTGVVSVIPFGSAVGTGFVNTPGSPIGVGTYGGSKTYGWLAFDPTNLVAYLTHYPKDSSGKYTTDRIQFTSTTAILTASWTRTDRVVAFLTMGRLLTRDGGYYDVCDSGGAIQSTFPAGSLKFAGEFYDAGTQAFRCWFTEVLSTDGSSSSSEASVRVYSIATSGLVSLK